MILYTYIRTQESKKYVLFFDHGIKLDNLGQHMQSNKNLSLASHQSTVQIMWKIVPIVKVQWAFEWWSLESLGKHMQSKITLCETISVQSSSFVEKYYPSIQSAMNFLNESRLQNYMLMSTWSCHCPIL